MRTSIATVSMGGLLRAKFEAIAAAGFEGVEIFETDVLAHDGTPEEVATMACDLGLEIVALQPLRDFEGMPEPQRTRTFERAKRKFELANRLGTTRLLICSNVSPLALGGLERLADDLWELGDLAASAGIDVGYEALAWGRHVWDYRDSWEIVRRADHPRIGLILDSFHILARRLPVDPIRMIPRERITFVQVSDAPLMDMNILQLSRHYRCFPGQGEMDLPGFMEALTDTGYDGWLSEEVFSDRFRMGSPKQIAFDGYRSLVHLTGRTKTAALPSVPSPEAVTFVEFSVNDADAGTLGALFTAIGFAHRGRHRSKSVEWYVQGDINLVINSEKTGFAHSHQITHGPSVAAIGLWVADASRQMDRAEALRATSFRQPVGAGELKIPAIRGVGGSLIYFLDHATELGRVWEVEFEPLVGPAILPTGLTRIDHIAQTIPFEELQSWRLFYAAILGLERTPQVDVADPAGLVESQVLYSPDRSVQIVLNSSQARQSQSSQFLNAYFGAGVQHIAFATDDILATVSAMRDAGVALLDIPDNYHDDLEARFDLDPDLAARMRVLGILYDEDKNGRYFQVYTQVIADRFFFEIVQRDGYTGFGAPNAPIRLAAQTQLSPPPGMPKI
jgi:4-hydroxyphenylpyruvate dioxygenase